MNSQTTTSSQRSGQGFSSSCSSSVKYGGLLEVSKAKQLRNNLFMLMAYIDSATKPIYAIQAVISIFRLFQIIGPALSVANVWFWNPNSVYYKIVGIISIFFHIVPNFVRQESFIYVLWIYIGIIVIFLTLVVSSAFYYKKSSKLPLFIATIISICVSTFGYLIHPIYLQIVGETIGWLSMNHSSQTTFFIISIVLSFVCFFIYMIFFTQVVANTVIFRPDSLMCAQGTVKSAILVFTCAITLLTGLAANISTIASYVFSIVAAILYFLSVALIKFGGAFISIKYEIMYAAFNFSGGLILLIIVVLDILKMSGNEIHLFVFLGIIFGSTLVFSFIIQRRRNKILLLLDGIESGALEVKQVLKSPHVIANIAVTGINFSHSYCLNWSLFKTSLEIFQNSVIIWTQFAKYVAIYPEETRVLEWIGSSIVGLKLTGGLAKVSTEQIHSILQQREANLSQNIKRKLNLCQKHTLAAKQKMRYFWDLVIQGNINEMENASNLALKAQAKCSMEFQRLILQYQNNRFVSRTFARYLREVEGDVLESNVWVENTKILQRGISVKPDLANTLGLNAFPKLPRVLALGGDRSSNARETTESTLDATELEEEVTQLQSDQFNQIHEKLEKLVIPSVRNSRILAFIGYFVFILIPVIALLVYVPDFDAEITEPVTYIYYISAIRSRLYGLSSMGLRYFMQNMFVRKDTTNFPAPNEPTPTPIPNFPHNLSLPITVDLPMQSMEFQKMTMGQIDWAIQTVGDLIQKLNDFRTFGVGKTEIDQARAQVFNYIIPYNYTVKPGEYYEQKISLVNVVSDFIKQSTTIRQTTDFEEDMLLNAPLSNTRTNIIVCAETISKSLAILLSYLRNLNEETHNLYSILEIVVPLFGSLILIGICLFINFDLMRNFKEINSTLTSLPKSAVSSVSESLRTLKKDTETTKTSNDSESDCSRQDENVLKIFNSAGDNTSSGNSERALIDFGTVLMILALILSYIFTFEMFMKGTQILQENSPHLDALTGAYGSLVGAFIYSSYIVLATNGYPVAYGYDQDSLDYLWGQLTARLSEASTSYHRSRFGGSKSDEYPYLAIEKGNEVANTIIVCPDEERIPNTMKEVYYCFNADMQYYFVLMGMYKIFLPVVNRERSVLPYQDNYNELYQLAVLLLFDSYFQPMFADIVPDITNSVASSITDYLPIVVIMLLLGFVGMICIFVNINLVENHMRYTLNFLMHCPMIAVLQSTRIVELLSGTFRNKMQDMATRSNEFYSELCDQMPDSILVFANQEKGKATLINKAACNMFGLEKETFINENGGTELKDFLNETRFPKNAQEIKNFIKQGVTVANGAFETLQNDGTEMYLDMNLTVTQFGSILTARDISMNVNHSKLIAEERAKSDALLSSILPEAMVKRVQAGETNISFAVQSASILFLDIVEFTPWCAANSASTVMSTLNTLFKRLDSLLATHATLTKVKCIGDCYMAAGGIFTAGSNPAVHAKEMVEFGCEAITMLEEMDKELDLDRRIRVGINTGGPIVAGVLGVGKPTFEILGPTINMAQQMEHHGVPMQVHISRATYELIYGGNFIVKERGEVAVKNGNVFTYLVTGIKNTN